jgi:hypothetical protein
MEPFSLYILSYDNVENIPALKEAISGYYPFKEIMSNSIMIYANETETAIYKRLEKVFGKKGRVVIAKVRGQYFGRFSADVWTWIEEKFPNSTKDLAP